MTKKPNDKERIKHMLEAIDKIFRYTKDLTVEKFSHDELVQDAVIKNFEILGEAAYHISKELKERYSHIEWKKIEGLRHILVHDYYKINPEILWNTKENNLPELKFCSNLQLETFNLQLKNSQLFLKFGNPRPNSYYVT